MRSLAILSSRRRSSWEPASSSLASATRDWYSSVRGTITSSPKRRRSSSRAALVTPSSKG